MTHIKGTTRAQTAFLRSFRKNPAGPPLADWPSPIILRRWLRRRAFRTALESIQQTLQFQADFHLAIAAAKTAQKLTTQPQDASPKNQDLAILRLSHQRQQRPAHFNLQSPARPALYNSSDRFNLDPYGAHDQRWKIPQPTKRQLKEQRRATQLKKVQRLPSDMVTPGDQPVNIPSTDRALVPLVPLVHSRVVEGVEPPFAARELDA
jgi:hypothetical protein